MVEQRYATGFELWTRHSHGRTSKGSPTRSALHNDASGLSFVYLKGLKVRPRKY